MDIIQLGYFVNIVECGCNLSLAARKIHITQSALSQMINNFESEEELLLFYRKSGRLEELTPSGKKLYHYAVELLAMYQEMQDMVRKESSKQKGTIRVGIPSLILRVFFSDFFPQFIAEHPEIEIEVIEAGCNELRQMFIRKDLDYAILIEPTSLDIKSFEEQVIQIDEITAFMAPDHPLANQAMLRWSKLSEYPLATFNSTFVTHELVKNKLADYAPTAKIVFTSSSWDYLMNTTHHANTVTILPSPIRRYYEKTEVIEKKFKDPIPFNIMLCRPIKSAYSTVENLLYENMLRYFYQPIE